MNRLFKSLLSLGAVTLVLATLAPVPTTALADDTPAGQVEFLDAKCNVCHGVPAAGIEAKTKSDKLRGPDLGGPLPENTTFEDIASYLRKEVKRNGAEHKRAFEGTDEALQSMLDWLANYDTDTATN